MPVRLRLGALAAGLLCVLSLGTAHGQELEPRAYASTPVGLMSVGAVYGYSKGSVLFDPALAIEDVTARLNSLSFALYGTFGLFGRSSNLTVVAPYAFAELEGLVQGEFARTDRAGWADPRVRLAVNLTGAPARGPAEFARHRQKTNIGASLSVSLPLGQYSDVRLVNLGTNRWGFKPELGISHLRGRWLLEAATGVWFYTADDDFLQTSTREQDTVLSLQAHAIYILPRRMWVAVDGNFYYGGQGRVDGEPRGATLRNSRFGVTFSFPLTRRHSIKASYSDGVFTRTGTDFGAVTVTYQYLWLRGL